MRLYDGVNERQMRLMKTMAAASGATFEDEAEVYNSETGPATIRTAKDAAALPIGIGFEQN